MTGRPQRAILEDMRNWKVWVSALAMVVAMGCGGTGGELSSAEVSDIYDICGSKASAQSKCVSAADTLISALEQGGSCDFRKIVSVLHSGTGLSNYKRSVQESFCPIPLPDRRPWFQRLEEWDGAPLLLLIVAAPFIITGFYLSWRRTYFPRDG